MKTRSLSYRNETLINGWSEFINHREGKNTRWRRNSIATTSNHKSLSNAYTCIWGCARARARKRETERKRERERESGDRLHATGRSCNCTVTVVWYTCIRLFQRKGMYAVIIIAIKYNDNNNQRTSRFAIDRVIETRSCLTFFSPLFPYDT